MLDPTFRDGMQDTVVFDFYVLGLFTHRGLRLKAQARWPKLGRLKKLRVNEEVPFC